jgi:hypothetical protein
MDASKGPQVAADASSVDVEKAQAFKEASGLSIADDEPAISERGSVDHLPVSRLQKFANRLEAIVGLEARGIERVPENMRNQSGTSYGVAQVGIVWFAANCTANNLTTGVLGPLEYNLGFVDAMMLVEFCLRKCLV